MTSRRASNGRRRRRPTSTANFGSGRREGHDASAFYDRFVAPEISADSTINEAGRLDVIYAQDARHMKAVASNSVALVVTSPPYFAGKQYEESLGVDGVPATYFEYLTLLSEVFAECGRVLEPGGRIAVNVANLGRRPYRSLSNDVSGILSDLGLLLRGEVIWWKGRAAGGSCAWGSFQRPTNPVLRDVTERIIIASKGRFDRALTPAERLDAGLPSTATISREEFMEATTDLWEIAPESATKVGHPAPFPVELPARLIEMLTYEHDVVLDPFMGSGSTAVAALRSGRHFIGFDTDASYVAAAEARIADERRSLAASEPSARPRVRIAADASVVAHGDEEPGHRRAMIEGRKVDEIVELLLAECGFDQIRSDVKPRGLGIVLSFVATDRDGNDWAFDVSGSFTTNQSGLRRADALWRALAKAGVLAQSSHAMPLVLLTTDRPTKGTAGDKALRTMCGSGGPVHSVIGLLDADIEAELTALAGN